MPFPMCVTSSDPASEKERNIFSTFSVGCCVEIWAPVGIFG